jgi:hypothetical protein
MGAVFTSSFDDGNPLDMKMAELLSKHGLAGTFYVPIKNCEGDPVLDSRHIRELAGTFEIGSHTCEHRYLNSLDVRQAYHQVHDGKKALEDMIGAPVEGFCYPGGRYLRRDVELVRACNFTYARTTMNLCFGHTSSPYQMPTTIQFYPHTRDVFLRNFAGSGCWSKRVKGLRLALQHEDWIERLYAMFEHACKSSGVFHLWGHSMQIDQLDAWDELDAFYRHVAAAIPPPRRHSNARVAALFPSGGRPVEAQQSA